MRRVSVSAPLASEMFTYPLVTFPPPSARPEPSKAG
jgi:hypothetical protein